MNKTKTLITILLCCTIIGCNQSNVEKGDFIFDKVINDDNTPMIAVVRNISKNDAANNELSDYLNNDITDDVIYYHITDIKLYEDLEIGERVTVTAPTTLLTSPPQAIAIEVKRYEEKIKNRNVINGPFDNK